MYVITHPHCLAHEMGHAHPESPDRLKVIQQVITQLTEQYPLQPLNATQAPLKAIKRAHSDHLIEQLTAHAPTEGYYSIDADTTMNPASLNAARYAAGSGLLALQMIHQKQTISHTAFCAVRPPGHHAEHDRAMGFCLLNHIAICALAAATDYHKKRIAIVDFDVHHGNGTEDIVADHSAIALFSTFQHPLYPGTGVPASAKNIHNYPLSAGTDSHQIQQLWQQRLLPDIKAYQPDLILVSAGFDAHKDDPLAGLNFEDDDYYFFARELKFLADELCERKLIAFLEGGYELNALSRSVKRFMQGLLDD